MDEAGEPSAEERRIAELLAHTIDVPVLASAVEQQFPADAADTLEQLEEADAADVLEQMDVALAADALSEMQPPLAVGVIEDLVGEDATLAGRLVQEMAPDDAADLLQELPSETAEAVLGTLPVDRAVSLRGLMGYESESAGGLMTTDFIALWSDMTVAQAVDQIRRKRPPENVEQLPVLDADGTFVGLVSLRDLLLSEPDERVADRMSSDVRVVRSGMDQEQVARDFDRYDLSLVPVLDDRDRLLGIVTVDDVIDIIREEQTEDVQKTVGAGAGEAVYSGIGEKLKGRFPWLGISLMMTCLAATVVLVFEDLIGRMPILAFLMPVIAALVGNAGHQALAVTLRGIVLEEVHRDRVAPLIVRETLVGLINGLALGLLIFGGLAMMSRWTESATPQLGLLAGLAIMLAMCVGTLSGASVPLIMRRLGADPAHSSAIFLIMITDAVSFSFLLGLVFVVLA
jgi:magnesium transporter